MSLLSKSPATRPLLVNNRKHHNAAHQEVRPPRLVRPPGQVRRPRGSKAPKYHFREGEASTEPTFLSINK